MGVLLTHSYRYKFGVILFVIIGRIVQLLCISLPGQKPVDFVYLHIHFTLLFNNCFNLVMKCRIITAFTLS